MLALPQLSSDPTMAMNRVQFQPGLSLPIFLECYGSEAACEQAVLQSRWPAGFVCPACEATGHSRFQRSGEWLWQCSACRHQTSLLAGTVFEHPRLPLTTWFLAFYVLTHTKTNVSGLELSRHLGVHARTAWRLKHKIMQAMTEREATRQLSGFVQIDDAYLGGERNGGKAGRGSENKRPFVMAVETNDAGHPGCAVIEPVAGFTTDALTNWAQRRLHADAEVFSDGLGAFRAVVPLGHAHTVIDAGGGRPATKVNGARWVNIVLSNVKRALDGTYHAFGSSSTLIAISVKPPGDSTGAFGSSHSCRVSSSLSCDARRGPNASCVMFRFSGAEIGR